MTAAMTTGVRLGFCGALLAWGAMAAQAQTSSEGTTFEVRHDHGLRGNCLGQLTILPDRVSFESVGDADHSRQWVFDDIREVRQDGIYQLEVRPFVGNTYNFDLSGRGLNSQEFGTLVDSIAAARIAPDGETASDAGSSGITIQAQHNHRFRGSCLGQLQILEDRVSFESVGNVDHSRQWFFADIREVDQNGIYKLEITPFVGNNYDFNLSGRGLNSEEFRELIDDITAARIR